MFVNYLKLAFRNLKRFKSYSFINICGLALGMAVSFLILLYVNNELSFDKYNQNADNIYRVITNDEPFSTEQPNTPFILAPTLKKDFPEIEYIARVKRLGVSIKITDKFSGISNFISADPAVFRIHDIQLVEGNTETVLTDPYSVTSSQSTAKKYFNDENPIGKILTIKNYGETYDLKITGIFKDLPRNSTFQANFISSITLNYKFYEKLFSYNKELNPQEDWSILSCNTYLLFPENYDSNLFTSKLPDFVKRYQEKKRFSYYLQPLKDIYLHSSNLINSGLPQGNLANVYLFAAIAFLILIIAGINFVILSIAKSATRTKEVGLRKVIGAARLDLIKQILFESVFMSFISLPFAIVFLELLLPQLNRILGVNLTINYLQDWKFISTFFSITILVGLLSGSYLAIYLSKFNPIEIFRARKDSGVSRSLFRRVLIVTQISIFVALITSSIIVYKQLYFMQNQNLGFNKENLLSISFQDNELRNRYKAYKNEISNFPGILKISGASYVPPTDGWTKSSFFGPNDKTKKYDVESISVDYNFIETMGLQIIEGRDFSEDFSTDTKSGYIFNEVAMKELDMKNPKWKKLSSTFKVTGVVKDFHIHSFREKIEPVMLSLRPERVREMILRIDSKNIPKTIAFLQGKWEAINPGKPFNFSFFDDSLTQLYLGEMKFRKIINYFTFLAIFIASLGLYGLASFMSKQRTKEIGIRKVLGSSLTSIISLLSKEFLLLTAIASFIAWPISFFYMNKWLQNFAYRTTVELWVYFLAGFLAISITLITISFQTIKSALINPVESLKYE
jgi:putative ABC transport system permease protein